MKGKHKKRGNWLWWLSLIVVAASALLLVEVYRRREKLILRPLQFRVATAEKRIGGLAPSRARTIGPAGQLMTLDPSGKYLMSTVSGKPVFITGEDAWSLQVQLSDKEIRYYLDDRASRGFNAIWVGLADNFYSKEPPRDFYGNVPFNGPDFTNENAAYWTRVDQTLREAAARGITVFASPAFVGADCSGGYCQSYRNSSVEVISAYGEFLGKRYRDFSNIVWLIGGDADPQDADTQAKLHVLARAIRSIDDVHLITTENDRGNSSIDVWAQASWLDLDALYVKPAEASRKAAIDYWIGSHPLFLFEDWYEGAPDIDDRGVREEGYEAVLTGCVLGRFFGNVAVWNFNWPLQSLPSWKSQLDSNGSVGQSWLGKLFRSREHWKLVPDLNHVTMTRGYESRSFFSYAKESLRSYVYGAPYRVEADSPVAARCSDGQTVIAYLPKGNSTVITIAMNQIHDPGLQAKAWWFNPHDGSSQLIGIFETRGSREFTAPGPQDWVLVVDSQAAHLAPPGSVDLKI